MNKNVLKTDVLILVEHKVRELDSAVLMKYYFEKKGLSVCIDSIRFNREKTMLKYNPKIVICPYAYSDKAIDRMQPLARFKNNPLFINMHHEQIGFNNDYPHLPDGKAKKTLHISWGNSFSKALLNCGCDSNSIITSGNPRLDFYSNPLSSINLSRNELARKYKLNPAKKWVLYIGDPGHLCIKNINPGSIIDEKKMAFYQASAKNRMCFFEYIKKYSINDCEFIYRPHPSYAAIDLAERDTVEMSNCESFHFISDESIRNWIVNSDVVMTFSSTSVVECAAANVPFYLLRAIECPFESEYGMLLNYEKKVDNFESFSRALLDNQSFNFSCFIDDIRDTFSFNMLGHINEYIVETITKYYEKNSEFGRFPFERKKYLKTKRRAIIKEIISKLRKIKFFEKMIIKKNDIRLLNVSEYGDDFFGEDDVDDLYQKFQNIFEGEMKNEKI